jgi:hypothetical protein
LRWIVWIVAGPDAGFTSHDGEFAVVVNIANEVKARPVELGLKSIPAVMLMVRRFDPGRLPSSSGDF